MFTTADEVDGDHYEDFVATCGFLFGDRARWTSSVTGSPSFATASPRPTPWARPKTTGAIGRFPAEGDGPDRAAGRHPGPRRHVVRARQHRHRRSRRPPLVPALRCRGRGCGAPRTHRVLEGRAVPPELHGEVQVQGGLRPGSAGRAAPRRRAPGTRTRPPRLAGRGALPGDRPPERPAALAPRRPGRAPGVRTALAPPVAPVLQRRIGLRDR